MADYEITESETENTSDSNEVIQSIASTAIEITSVTNILFDDNVVAVNPNEEHGNEDQRSIIVYNSEDENETPQVLQPISVINNLTANNNQNNQVLYVDESEENDSDDDDYAKSRAKIPRLDLDSDVKKTNVETECSNFEEEVKLDQEKDTKILKDN